MGYIVTQTLTVAAAMGVRKIFGKVQLRQIRQIAPIVYRPLDEHCRVNRHERQGTRSANSRSRARHLKTYLGYPGFKQVPSPMRPPSVFSCLADCACNHRHYLPFVMIAASISHSLTFYDRPRTCELAYLLYNYNDMEGRLRRQGRVSCHRVERLVIRPDQSVTHRSTDPT